MPTSGDCSTRSAPSGPVLTEIVPDRAGAVDCSDHCPPSTGGLFQRRISPGTDTRVKGPRGAGGVALPRRSSSLGESGFHAIELDIAPCPVGHAGRRGARGSVFEQHHDHDDHHDERGFPPRPRVRGGNGEDRGGTCRSAAADASTGIPTQNGAVLANRGSECERFRRRAPSSSKASLLDERRPRKARPGRRARRNVKTFISDSAVLGMIGPFKLERRENQRSRSPTDAGLAQISPVQHQRRPDDGGRREEAAHGRIPDTNSYFRVCTRDSRQGAALAQFAQKLGYKEDVRRRRQRETYGKGLADKLRVVVQRARRNDPRGASTSPANQQDFKGAAHQGQSARAGRDLLLRAARPSNRRWALTASDG